MSNATVERHAEILSNLHVTKKLGNPTYKKMQTAHKLASANAVSIEATRGGLNDRNLAITLKPTTNRAFTA